MTLLKWKLLATPQLGGASSFFSNIIHPGVHVKSWRGSPKNDKVVTHDNSSSITNSNNASRTIVEEELGSSVDYTPSLSSSSTAVVTGYSPSGSGNHSDDRRVTAGIHSRAKTTTTTTTNTINSSTINNITTSVGAGMNDISGLLLDTNNNNNNNIVLTNTLPNNSDTVPHPSMMGNNVTATGRLNPVLKMGWLPGMRQPIATRDIGLASLIDDKVD